MAILEDELKEINNYIRHVAQLLVVWYTFFIAGNLVAAGWFAFTSSATGPMNTRQAFWTVCMVFIAVNVLGVMACVLARSYFGQADSRIKDILAHLSTEGVSLSSLSPVPVKLFRNSTLLAIFSLIVLICAWLSLLVIKVIKGWDGRI